MIVVCSDQAHEDEKTTPWDITLGYLETIGGLGIDNGCESICTNVFSSNTVHLDL